MTNAAGTRDAETSAVPPNNMADSFQLSELVDELARSSDDDGMGDEGLTPCTKMVRDMASDPAVVTQVAASTEVTECGPSCDRSAGERIATAFWRCAHEAGFTMLCEALTFSGLRDELPRLMAPGHTIIAPTNEAWAKMDESVRKEPRLVRQLLLGHMCSGALTLQDLKQKNCACAVAGQTHAVYEEAGNTCETVAISPKHQRPVPVSPDTPRLCIPPDHVTLCEFFTFPRCGHVVRYVGTGRFGRTDLAFNGGVIHEVTTVLMVLSLVRDSHSEQVWKKSLQPSPILSAVGGISNTGSEYEVHGCLLHAATGQLVPEALRGHVRPIKAVDEEQRLAFTEVTVLTKPPSLAKRRGVGSVDGSNRYRLLFSIWNTSSLSYISWQHMATPLVVRNSFHMLPIEEKVFTDPVAACTHAA